MLEDLRGYLQLATGLSEVTVAKAKEAAAALLSHALTLGASGPQVVGQVQELADDLLVSSRTNREALLALIRGEVDRTVGRMGFVREDELAALRRHVERLEAQVRAQGAAPASAPAAPSSSEAHAPDEPVKKKKVVAPGSLDGEAS